MIYTDISQSYPKDGYNNASTCLLSEDMSLYLEAFLMKPLHSALQKRHLSTRSVTRKLIAISAVLLTCIALRMKLDLWILLFRKLDDVDKNCTCRLSFAIAADAPILQSRLSTSFQIMSEQLDEMAEEQLHLKRQISSNPSEMASDHLFKCTL